MSFKLARIRQLLGAVADVPRRAAPAVAARLDALAADLTAVARGS